ncbi:MAG: hypothetical protein HY282_15025 [Nitrospirae bacterium]|nr:hypothetical protein [Candidatus Manganitrophaceae bacterium]
MSRIKINLQRVHQQRSLPLKLSFSERARRSSEKFPWLGFRREHWIGVFLVDFDCFGGGLTFRWKKISEREADGGLKLSGEGV